MPLTNEQKRQIEENRQKALAKRQKHETVINPSGKANAAAQPPLPPLVRQVAAAPTSNRPRTFMQTVRCKFKLLTRHEFGVEMNYHAPAISIFKKMPTGR